MPSTEIFDVCDQQDQVIGQANREEVHSRNLLHRAVHIWVWRSDGRLLVHLRSASKDQFPACLTSSASGHLDQGETYESAAHRELGEELKLQGDLKWVCKLSAKESTAFEHTVLYFLKTDAIPQPDPNEIAELRWMTFEEVQTLAVREPSQLTPPFLSLIQEMSDRDIGAILSR